MTNFLNGPTADTRHGLGHPQPQNLGILLAIPPPLFHRPPYLLSMIPLLMTSSCNYTRPESFYVPRSRLLDPSVSPDLEIWITLPNRSRLIRLRGLRRLRGEMVLRVDLDSV